MCLKAFESQTYCPLKHSNSLYFSFGTLAYLVQVVRQQLQCVWRQKVVTQWVFLDLQAHRGLQRPAVSFTLGELKQAYVEHSFCKRKYYVKTTMHCVVSSAEGTRHYLLIMKMMLFTSFFIKRKWICRQDSIYWLSLRLSRSYETFTRVYSVRQMCLCTSLLELCMCKFKCKCPLCVSESLGRVLFFCFTCPPHW